MNNAARSTSAVLELAGEFETKHRTWRVAITPDAELLFASNYFEVFAWQRATGRRLWTWKPPHAVKIPTALTCTRDGATLLVAGNAKLFWLEVRNGALVRTTETPGYVNRMAFLRDGARIVACGAGLSVFDALTGTTTVQFDGAPKSMQGFWLDAQESRVAGVGAKSLFLWDLATGELLRKRKVARFGTTAVVLLPDASVAWITEAGTDVASWRLAKKTVEAGPKVAPAGGTHELSADPSCRWMIASTTRGPVLLDPATGAEIAHAKLRQDPIDDFAIDRAGSFCMTAHVNGTARLWRIEVPVQSAPQTPT